MAGQPTKYDPKYCDEIIAYFSDNVVEFHNQIQIGDGEKREMGKNLFIRPPMFGQFARKIGVHIDTLHAWKEAHPEFSEAYKRCKELQKEFIQECLLMGVYSGGAAVFAAKNMTDMRDKTEVDHTNDGGKFESVPMTPAILAATKAYEEALKKEMLD